jgi:hypothetical protein
MTWRIAKWSREHGRGTIESEHFKDVAFDAHCAEVDDFKEGEPVHVEVENIGGTMRVKHVWPDDPRFKLDRNTPSAPPLDAVVRSVTEKVLSRRQDCCDYRVASLTEETLVIEGDEDSFAYGAQDELIVHGLIYIDLPMSLEDTDMKNLRVSTDEERAYLHANKTELGPKDIALTIARCISRERSQFYFLVGSALEYREKR